MRNLLLLFLLLIVSSCKKSTSEPNTSDFIDGYIGLSVADKEYNDLLDPKNSAAYMYSDFVIEYLDERGNPLKNIKSNFQITTQAPYILKLNFPKPLKYDAEQYTYYASVKIGNNPRNIIKVNYIQIPESITKDKILLNDEVWIDDKLVWAPHFSIMYPPIVVNATSAK
ncbi:hypothetical protein [Sphingobacterium bovistauri]|uniref:Uncharacterized protein n=1 Tax=Sphingobacterium bovistauri TaxID=2781959 RepID=A0ABS7Z7Z4_9SPHI|nr:hypothetical protein [Sphingobacterium bovistauri]MCA5005702.1 hypothetical protein [Sphingobacterium bovistauri]